MRSDEAWWLRGRCCALSPAEADALFFPGPGGKPHKADNFCASCPVLSFCLSEAILNGEPGFQAGTTETQRAAMRAFVTDTTFKLRALNMPEEPTAAQGPLLKIVEPTPDSHAWMDLVEPNEETLIFLDRVDPESHIWELAVS